jgi:uncharacterized UBP type Zn finger protein
MNCNYKSNNRFGLINLGITCFIAVPFQLVSQHILNKKIDKICVALDVNKHPEK